MTKQKKPVPPIHQKPEPVRLKDPVRVVSVNRKTRTVTLAGSPPPELVEALKAAAEVERRRLDMPQRLKGYAAACLVRVMPHFGKRPRHITAAKWKDVEQRIRLLQSLPADAPAEAHDAFKALQALHRLVDELASEGDYSDTIERAICWAIDLGQLLQRSQTQIECGEAVDIGRRNAKSRTAANDSKREAAELRSQRAEAEFNRRMHGNTQKRMKTATLGNMAQMKDTDGEPLYGSLRTLTRYAKTWKSATPPE